MTVKTITGTVIAGVAAMLAVPSTATATNLMSWGFTDLSGNYNAGTSAFHAVSVSDALFRTDGDVTRLVGPGGTAQYNTGALPGAVVIDLNVQILGGGIATGSGQFRILDNDGDALAGSIGGAWIAGANGTTFFNGSLTGVHFEVLPGHVNFNGPSGGQFPLGFDAPPPYEGSLVQLFINPAGGFFAQSFEHISTQASAVITPAPGAVGLVGLAAAAGLRRRRR